MALKFIDSNILVYVYDIDAGAKHQKAQEILRACWKDQSGAVSIQVLQEFYVAVTRKLGRPLASKIARQIIETYAAWPVYSPSIKDIIAAIELHERYMLSFWDALIVIAAQNSGATTLFSEDLQHGQKIDGIKIINPFV